MSTHYDPGPPLKPEDEFCACEPPTGAEYAKALGMAFLGVTVGGLAWCGVALATHRLWGFTTIVAGLGTGWAINWAADNHRSTALGVIGAATTVLTAICGYLLLFLPFFGGMELDRRLSWYDLLMALLGAFMAYRLAGPKPKPNDGD